MYSIVDPSVQFVDLRLEMLRVKIDLGKLCGNLGIELSVEHPGVRKILVRMRRWKNQGRC